MSAGWVAGATRSRTLLRRTLSPTERQALDGATNLAGAVQMLRGTAYRHAVRTGQGLPAAERAVAETLLWNLRVLAGWQPHRGVDVLRTLCGWFEIANTDDLLRGLGGQSVPRPYHLGALSTAWRALARSDSRAALRARLATSPWGDPGEDHPAAVGLSMRFAWARRVAARAPEAARWASGAAALLFARERFGAGYLPSAVTRQSERLLGPAAVQAESFPDFARMLPASARWAVSGVDGPELLWRAEPRWWSRVEQDATSLVGRSRFGPAAVVGAAALLAVDAWRVVGALELAARGGPGDVSAGPEATDVTS